MSKTLFLDGLILIKVWAVGFFWLHISGIIHILPAIAIFVSLIWFIYKKSIIPKYKL
jgi:hypothetical protein